MKHLFSIILLLNLHLIARGQVYSVEVESRFQSYEALDEPTFLCNDSIGRKHFFTIDPPITILHEEVDSFFIIDWNTLHLNLGNKKSKESRLFVPFNTALRKKIAATDSVGFSISYQLKGEVGSRILRIQWKDVKPKNPVSPNDVFNIQMILDESDQSISYHFGPMPSEFNTWFTLFGQGRVPALYFIDDFKSFTAPRNEIYFITSAYQDENKLDVAEFILLDGKYTDEQYSSHLSYYFPSIPLAFGTVFKWYHQLVSAADELPETENKHEIYPIPANNELHLNTKQSANSPCEIYNPSGITEQKGKIENNTINLESLPGGLHFLKWQSDDGKLHFGKFIKQ